MAVLATGKALIREVSLFIFDRPIYMILLTVSCTSNPDVLASEFEWQGWVDNPPIHTRLLKVRVQYVPVVLAETLYFRLGSETEVQ